MKAANATIDGVETQFPCPCFLGLGANLGARVATLRAAVLTMNAHERMTVDFDRGIASLYETTPVGCADGQPNYLNTAIRIETTLAPTELLAATMDIERRLGRVRKSRWEERVIDIDLLLYGDWPIENTDFQNSDAPTVDARVPLISLAHCRWLVEESGDLALPHPRICERRFVLDPLSEIGGDVIHPVAHCTIKALSENAAKESANQTISRVAGPEWVQPEWNTSEVASAAS